MITTSVAVLIGIAIGIVVSCVGFVWLNRNKADQLDAAEKKVRDYTK